MSGSVESLRRLALRPTDSGRFLCRAVDGGFVFPLVDTAWEIFHRCTKEEVLFYLDHRRHQNFDGILTVLVPELDVKGHGNRPYQGELDSNGRLEPPEPGWDRNIEQLGGSKLFYPNRNGEVPFHDDEQVDRTYLPSEWLLISHSPTRPNAAYFSFVDWIVDQAAQRGILVWLVPTWSRFVNTGWADGPIIFDEMNARSYGSFLGSRYPFCPKLLGGDSNPVWTNGQEVKLKAPDVDFEDPVLDGVTLPDAHELSRNDTFAVWDAMAAGIVEAETPAWARLGRPFLTYHPCPTSFAWSPKALASNFFGSSDWLVLDGCQSGHADAEKLFFEPPIHRWDARASHEPISEMWKATPVRPVIDLESHYEEAHNGLVAGASFSWDEHDIRSGAWQSVLSGACGVVYGANVVWQMYDDQLFKANPSCYPVCGTSKTMSWKRSLDLPGPSHLRILVNFLMSLPSSTLEARQPRQDVLIDNECPAQWLHRDGRVDVMADAADNNATWLVAHSGRGYGFTLDLARAFDSDAQLVFDGVDMATGEKRPVEVSRDDGGLAHLSSRGSGTTASDWVLVVTCQ